MKTSGWGCLIKIVITISGVFPLYSQFNLNVLYSNVPSIVYYDAYKGTICITKTIFMLLSLIKTNELWRITPSDFSMSHHRTLANAHEHSDFGVSHQSWFGADNRTLT